MTIDQCLKDIRKEIRLSYDKICDSNKTFNLDEITKDCQQDKNDKKKV